MPQDFDFDQFKITYFEECNELLHEAEEHLNTLQNNIDNVDIETLHAIFRCVHSIKGGAGAFNFSDLVKYSHTLETLLDKLREEEISLNAAIVEKLLAFNDILSSLVQAAQNEENVESETWKNSEKEIEDIIEGRFVPDAAPVVQEDQPRAHNDISGYNATPEEEEEQGWGLFLAPETEIDTTPVSEEKTEAAFKETVVPEVETKASSNAPTYKIHFIPEPHLLKFANEPLLLARELKTLGECKIIAETGRLPSIRTMNSDEAYLSWVYELTTDRPLEDIEEVFEFVIDDCILRIEMKHAPENHDELVVDTDIQAVNKAEETVEEKEKEENIPQIETDIKTIAVEDSSPVEADVKDVQPVVRDVLNTVSETAAVQVEKIKKEVAEFKKEVKAPAAAPKVSSIRVDLDRVDKLVNMVGELVITQAMLMQQADDLPNKAGQCMSRGFEELSAHTRELQESVMAIRMQPVKSVFARMPRLVRELASKLDKKVDLITSGEMTEVDKTVIEQLMDPLTHMIRNSVDHGIEKPEERIKLGKDEKAKIYLNAEHRSGRIQIEIIDDGAGINRQRVVEKALEKGLISADDDLDEQDIDNLIFAPGFSTAESVSDVSGRGVGMDVVRKNLVNLGGRISVTSTPGRGTRFLMSLPLTLAVLDGMIVKCGTEKYIIPLTSVIESIHPLKEELKALVNDGTLISVRGEYIRLVELHKIFNVKEAVTQIDEALVVIVDTERFGHVGIVVDELLGQQQVVIKSLEENYDPIEGISAATILGNGKVALILDVDGLSEMEHDTKRFSKITTNRNDMAIAGDHS